MAKLGNGTYATVWLARDLAQNRYVSLKICRADFKDGALQEVYILKTLQGKRGGGNILQLFDDFTLEGPNGIHQCIVTEVVMPLTKEVLQKCEGRRGSMIHELINAFHFLHGQGIAHGDPSLNNLGAAVITLDKMSMQDVMNSLEFKLTPVIPQNPKEEGNKSYPPYVVQPVKLMDVFLFDGSFPGKQSASPFLKVIDFGLAFKITSPPPRLRGWPPLQSIPPEILLHILSQRKDGTAWSLKADVWSVACLMYMVDAGIQASLFAGGDKKLTLVGAVRQGDPSQMYERYFKDQKLRVLVDREQAWRVIDAGYNTCTIQGKNRKIFVDLLKKMVVSDPSKRCSMADIVQHQFLSTV